MSCLLDQLMVLIDTDFMLWDRDVQRAQTVHLIADGRDFTSKFITSTHITELGVDELENALSDDLRLCDLATGRWIRWILIKFTQVRNWLLEHSLSLNTFEHWECGPVNNRKLLHTICWCYVTNPCTTQNCSGRLWSLLRRGVEECRPIFCWCSQLEKLQSNSSARRQTVNQDFLRWCPSQQPFIAAAGINDCILDAILWIQAHIDHENVAASPAAILFCKAHASLDATSHKGTTKNPIDDPCILSTRVQVDTSYSTGR